MIAKFIVTLVLILIVGSLGSALIYLLQGRGGTNTARALTWRIGLSMALFIGLIAAGQLGLIQPHGLATAPQTATAPQAK